MLFYLLTLYLPGFLCLWGAKTLSKRESLAFAPLISTAYYATAAIVYDRVGIPSSFPTLFIPLTVIGAAILCFRIFRARGTAPAGGKHAKPNPKASAREAAKAWAVPLLYAVIGMLCCYFFFIKRLSGPDAVFFAWDNHYHLNAIQSFAQSGDYSSFDHVHYVGTSSPVAIGRSSFYPSAWHCFGAMAVNTLGVSVPLAVNAFNATLIAVVYPLGIWSFFHTLFPHNRKLLTAGAFLPLAFTSTLWEFLHFGPLYSMILACSLAAPGMSIFLKMLQEKTARARAALIGLFAVGLIGIALAQTSGVFLMAVFLAAAWVQHVYTAAKAYGATRNRALAYSAGLATFCLLVWVLCLHAPFLQKVLGVNWGTIEGGLFQVFAGMVLLAFNGHVAQPLLSVLVVTGVVVLLASKKESVRKARWLLFPLVFFCLAYLVCALSEGSPLRNFLAGFWYKDFHRLAANIVIAALPVAALGLETYLDAIAAFCTSDRVAKAMQLRPTVVETLATVIFFVLVFYPNYSLPAEGSVTTSFGKLEDDLTYDYSYDNFSVFQPDERNFAQEVIADIPAGSLIINTPNDGSGFMYALYGANIYYRYFQMGGPSETWESKVIRADLDEYATDPEVQKAVEDIDAKYVLVMNQDEANSYRLHFGVYHREDWEGIESITPETKGFTPVLSEGSMTLYRIDPIEN